jgi:hypothetical protein
MAFATVHTIKSPRFSFLWLKNTGGLLRLKSWGISFNAWRHRSPINEVDVYLLPALELVYRRGGSMRMLKLEVSWGIWTARAALYAEKRMGGR